MNSSSGQENPQKKNHLKFETKLGKKLIVWANAQVTNKCQVKSCSCEWGHGQIDANPICLDRMSGDLRAMMVEMRQKGVMKKTSETMSGSVAAKFNSCKRFIAWLCYHQVLRIDMQDDHHQICLHYDVALAMITSVTKDSQTVSGCIVIKYDRQYWLRIRP